MFTYPRQHNTALADREDGGSGTLHELISGADARSRTAQVPILSIHPGESPRLNGEDRAHIARLAQTDADLPPILVDRRTRKVIDGMHRLMAASLRGHQMIDVIFYDGGEADVFLRAVEANIAHGLPLSQADRRAAACRIIETHPQMSDRAIAQSTGLAAKTIASIRRSTGDATRLNARVGRDGRVRPLDSGQGRRRAAEILSKQPGTPLREVALASGISPATALDVRRRLQRGQSPVPARLQGRAAASGTATSGTAGEGGQQAAGLSAVPSQPTDRPIKPARRAQLPPPAATVEKLLRDPSLRNSEGCRQILRLLHLTAASADQLHGMSAAVPPHCVHQIAQVAQQYAQMWDGFATELNRRAQVTDPTEHR
jgi:ParB-like chromosome segregation protein Spo0J